MATNAQFIEFNFTTTYPGAKIYHYAAGTTTLQNVWTDRAKTSAAAQPVVADSNGVASFFGDGIYKFRVDTSADVTLYTWDNVNVVDLPLRGKGANIASGGTLTLGTDGDYFHVTGSTGPITAISGTQSQAVLIFDSTPTLNYSASLLLKAGVNYTAAANDTFGIANEGSGVWREIFRTSSAGTATGLLTTKGDLLVYTTAETRLGIGANGTLATADSTAASGLKWGAGPLTTKGDLMMATAVNTPARLAVGSNGTILMARSADTNGIAYVAPLNKQIYGLTYDNGTDAINDLNINVGGAMDATGVYWMTLSGALGKQSDVGWAVGGTVGTPAGGLDTGAVGNNDYYIWLIARSDTGVVDALYSLSSTAPSMPTNYDFKRLVGWMKRSGGTIVAFHTYETEGGGLEMNWDSPTLDVNLANTLTTSRRTDAVKVPLNISVEANLNVIFQDNGGYGVAWVYCPDQTDVAPSATVAPLSNIGNVGASVNGSAYPLRVRTSATGTIAARATIATVDLYAVATVGFRWARRV